MFPGENNLNFLNDLTVPYNILLYILQVLCFNYVNSMQNQKDVIQDKDFTKTCLIFNVQF